MVAASDGEMYVPDERWRSKEDLKVILVTPRPQLTKKLALSFFQQFGVVTECYLLNASRIACAHFTSEEDAEKALETVKVVLDGGIACDVTTFKTGNRKVFLHSVPGTEEQIREYFETRYGPILRVEIFGGQCSCFILFLKVDSGVAARHTEHLINRMHVRVRPGFTPGSIHERSMGRHSMYPVSKNHQPFKWPSIDSPLPSPQLHQQLPAADHFNGFSSRQGSVPSSSLSPSTSFLSSRTPSPALCTPLFSTSEESVLSDDSPPDIYEYGPNECNLVHRVEELVDNLKCLSFKERAVTEERAVRRPTPTPAGRLDWRNTIAERVGRPVNAPQYLDTRTEFPPVLRRGVAIRAASASPTQPEEIASGGGQAQRHQEVMVPAPVPAPVPVAVPVPSAAAAPVVDWEEERRRFNLPLPHGHVNYARDERGFPRHHKGRYIISSLRDRNFHMRKRVSFNEAANSVLEFSRSEFEKEFLVPYSKSKSKIENPTVDPNSNDWFADDYEEDAPVVSAAVAAAAAAAAPPLHGFPEGIAWPVELPGRPAHFPLMEAYTWPNETTKLNLDSAIRYMSQLDTNWKLRDQQLFLNVFAPFLRTFCAPCKRQLTTARSSFEHLFSKDHLASLARHKIKYCMSDFYFWHHLLLKNFSKVNRSARGTRH